MMTSNRGRAECWLSGCDRYTVLYCSGGWREFRPVCLSQSADQVLNGAKRTVCEQRHDFWKDGSLRVVATARLECCWRPFSFDWLDFVHVLQSLLYKSWKNTKMCFALKAEETFHCIKASPQLFQYTPDNRPFQSCQHKHSFVFLVAMIVNALADKK